MHFSSNLQLFNEIVAYLELFCVVAQLVSLSNIDDNNGKKKYKQESGLLSKTKTLNFQHTLYQLSLLSLYDCGCQT